MTRRSTTTPAAVLGAAALLAMSVHLLAATPAPAEPRKGVLVPVAGRVVDAHGEPLAGVTVLLEASRTYFSLRRFESTEGEALKLPATTDDDGRFHLDWSWDGHYNTFELAVGVEIRRRDEPDFEIAHRRDVTDTVTGGGSYDLVLEVEDAGYLRWLRRFLDGEAGEEEDRLFRERGRPDRLEESRDRPGETTWWYFAEGKAYVFRDGRLDQVVPFEPVIPGEPASGS